MDTRIIAVNEIYERSNRSVELTFDQTMPTLMSVIKKQINQVGKGLKK
jgi:hypothetical protein